MLHIIQMTAEQHDKICKKCGTDPAELWDYPLTELDYLYETNDGYGVYALIGDRLYELPADIRRRLLQQTFGGLNSPRRFNGGDMNRSDKPCLYRCY